MVGEGVEVPLLHIDIICEVGRINQFPTLSSPQRHSNHAQIPLNDSVHGSTIVTSRDASQEARQINPLKVHGQEPSQANDMSLIMHYTFIPLFYIAMQAYNTTQCHRHEHNSFSLT